MDFDVMRDTLKRSELFAGLDQSQLGLLIMNAEVRRFSEGETVYRKGDAAGGAFALIASGRISVVAEDGYVLKALEAGEVIGEVGTLSQHGLRTVTLTASEQTEIIEWQLQNIENDSPELLKRLKDLAWKRIKYWSE